MNLLKGKNYQSDECIFDVHSFATELDEDTLRTKVNGGCCDASAPNAPPSPPSGNNTPTAPAVTATTPTTNPGTSPTTNTPNPSDPSNPGSGYTGGGYEPPPEVMSNPQAYGYWKALQALAEQQGDPDRYKNYNVLGDHSKKQVKLKGANTNVDTISLDSRDQYRISKMLMKGERNAIDIVLTEKKQKTASKENRNDCYFKICVDQPGNGNNRNTYVFNNMDDIDTGHVFLEIGNSKTGEVITRGLYPDLGDTRRKKLVEGIITEGKVYDDSSYNKDKVDVEKVFFISEYDYYTTKSSILQDESNPPLYQLSDYNCTNWVVDKANKIGLNIPQTIGSWPFGEGLNPGDLGEDLR
jgi:hypothetical protein